MKRFGPFALLIALVAFFCVLAPLILHQRQSRSDRPTFPPWSIVQCGTNYNYAGSDGHVYGSPMSKEIAIQARNYAIDHQLDDAATMALREFTRTSKWEVAKP